MISNYAKLSVVFFQEMVKTLGVSDNFNISIFSHSDLVMNAIRKYEKHPSVKKIRENITVASTFNFADVGKPICHLSSSKVATFKNIPTKYLKVTSDLCSPFLTVIRNQEIILSKNLPQKLELAETTPLYDKSEKILDLLVFYLQYQRSSNG